MSQLQSTKAVCSAPTYLVALMWPKSHVPVPHLSIAKVKMGDSSWGVMRSRKVGVPIAKEGGELSVWFTSIVRSEGEVSRATDFQMCCLKRDRGQGCLAFAAGP